MRIFILFLFFVFFGVGIGVGYSFRNNEPQKLQKKDSERKTVQSQEIRGGEYKFISPLLECEYLEEIGSVGFNVLQQKLEGYIENLKKSNEITEASVYFRDLNNGPWFGIDEYTEFSPASLLKLPYMMAYFKAAESDSSLLAKKIEYKEDLKSIPQFFGKPSLKKGEAYTAEELIEKMIINSDNDALVLLDQNIENANVTKIGSDLGVETASDDPLKDYITVKGYASFFRILFNASYLSKTFSEKSLEILSRVEFKQGIPEGVASNITVAHKYGERELQDSNQLHDCGIVYYPKHPYLLCIMTRGVDTSVLLKTIQTISKEVFEEADRRYKSEAVIIPGDYRKESSLTYDIK